MQTISTTKESSRRLSVPYMKGNSSTNLSHQSINGSREVHWFCLQMIGKQKLFPGEWI